MQHAKNSSLHSRRTAFTLAELMVALAICSIITAAVVSMAFALSSADEASDDTSQKQAQLRYATLTISDLLRHCMLICSRSGNNMAVWRADDDDDGLIDPTELVFLEAGNSGTSLELLWFASGAGSVSMDSIINGTARSALESSNSPQHSVLIPQCSNISAQLDASPPWTRNVSISCDMVENAATRHYQIDVTLLVWAGHLLDSSGNIVSDDD